MYVLKTGPRLKDLAWGQSLLARCGAKIVDIDSDMMHYYIIFYYGSR